MERPTALEGLGLMPHKTIQESLNGKIPLCTRKGAFCLLSSTLQIRKLLIAFISIINAMKEF